MIKALVSIIKEDRIDGVIRNSPNVKAAAVTAASGATGSVTRRKTLGGGVTDGEREFSAESVRPTSANYVDFFKVEDSRLIILGAISVMRGEDGLYIDCATNDKWLDPELRDGVLTIRQAYSIRQIDTILEVK